MYRKSDPEKVEKYLDLLPKLRKAIGLSKIDGGIQLTDHDTGFAVELSDEFLSETITSPEKKKELVSNFEAMGLIDPAQSLFEIRKLQRSFLDASHSSLLDRVRERLCDITAQIPFFKKNKSIYDVNRIKTIEDFQKLPFMRKKDLRESFPGNLLPQDVNVSSEIENGTLKLVSTSGSTEDRLQIIVKNQLDRLPFGSDDLFGISIGGKQPRTAILTTPVCSGSECSLGNDSYEDRLSKSFPDLYLQAMRDPFSVQRPVIEAFCTDIEKFKPTILLVDPIYMQCIARKANELNIKLPKVDVIQHSFEYGPKTALRDLNNLFKSKLFNSYGASEENRLAVQCHRGALHVRSDVVYLEIVNSKGPCDPGEVGSVVITTFDSVTPLIRYLIGDIASWTGKNCDCAFSLWPTIDFHGRSKDMIFSNNLWHSTLTIDRAIGAPEWLDFCHVIQHDKNAYEVKLIPSLGNSVNLPDISQRLEDYINPKNIFFKEVTRLGIQQSLKVGFTQNKFSGAPELL